MEDLEESNWKLFCGTRVIYFNLLEMDFSNRVEEMLLAVSGNCLPSNDLFQCNRNKFPFFCSNCPASDHRKMPEPPPTNQRPVKR